MPISLHSLGVAGFEETGEVYIIGGITEDEYHIELTVRTIYRYNIRDNKWV